MVVTLQITVAYLLRDLLSCLRACERLFPPCQGRPEVVAEPLLMACKVEFDTSSLSNHTQSLLACTQLKEARSCIQLCASLFCLEEWCNLWYFVQCDRIKNTQPEVLVQKLIARDDNYHRNNTTSLEGDNLGLETVIDAIEPAPPQPSTASCTPFDQRYKTLTSSRDIPLFRTSLHRHGRRYKATGTCLGVLIIHPSPTTSTSDHPPSTTK